MVSFQCLLGPICLFLFYFHESPRWIKEELATFYVKSFVVAALLFSPLICLALFLCMVLGSILVSLLGSLPRVPHTAAPTFCSRGSVGGAFSLHPLQRFLFGEFPWMDGQNPSVLTGVR